MKMTPKDCQAMLPAMESREKTTKTLKAQPSSDKPIASLTTQASKIVPSPAKTRISTTANLCEKKTIWALNPRAPSVHNCLRRR